MILLACFSSLYFIMYMEISLIMLRYKIFTSKHVARHMTWRAQSITILLSQKEQLV